jgi:putrescine---pyruvate transaminase
MDQSENKAGRSFWHPFANMAEVPRERLRFVRGRGATVFDDDGREYFDATAGLWYCAVGHGRERIAAAIARQANELAAYSCFGAYATKITLDAADRIAGLSALDSPRVFLTSGGSDGIDTAAKIVRQYFALKGAPQKTTMIARDSAYHGTNAFGTSLGGIDGNREGWGTLVPDVVHVPALDVAAIDGAIQDLGADRVGAVFVEPVMGAGGVLPAPDEYLPEVAECCHRHGVLLVCDEVITGVGRTGYWTACHRYGVEPDLQVFAKGLTSGYQPLGAVAVSAEVAAPFFDGDGAWLRHGYTYSGHATACAAVLENLAIIEEEDLVSRASELGRRLPHLLGSLAEVDGVAEVRQIGLTAAIQLDGPLLAERGATTADVVAGCRERGQLTRLIAGDALQFSPPFVSSEAEIEGFGSAVADSLSAVLR